MFGFGSVTGTTATTATGDNNIDGLIKKLRWTDKLVSYSFTDNFNNDYESGYDNYSTHSASFQTLNATQRNVARNWAWAFNNISNLNLAEYTGAYDRDATIRMAMSSYPTTAKASVLENNSVESGDIFFNPNKFNTPKIGNYAYITFGHELGHALGLNHGHETDGIRGVAMNADRDSMEFSIMTYRGYIGAPVGPDDGYTNETWGFAQSLMMYDIRAIQQEYGAWFGSNATNSTYTFSTITGEMFINGVGQGTPCGNRIFRTIWDGNGYDTYDFSNYSTNLSIDLNPGGWSDLAVGSNFQRANLDANSTAHYARGHVFNALQYNGDARSLIENANGGSGNDTIIGNSANNVITGGAGNDIIYGDTGNDTLYGWTGIDIIYGGDGNDTVDGGDGNDIIYLGNGNDVVSTSSSGDDKFYGEDGDDEIYCWSGNNETYDGGAGSDTLAGYGGNDLMDGGTGDDYIYAGSGNDFVEGGDGNDIIYGDDGDDYVDGGDGDDIIYLGAGNDFVNIFSLGNDKFYGEAGDDSIYGSSGNETFDGGAGNDWIRGGGGIDYMDGGSGIDTIDYSYWNGGGKYNLDMGIVYGHDSSEEKILNFEDIITGAGSDDITGNAADNLIQSGDGNDFVDGGDGNDIIYLGGGDDFVSIYSSLGDDKFYGEAGDDYINGYIGNETFDGGSGNDTLFGDGGNDTMNGGTGNDKIYGDDGNDWIYGDDGNDIMYGGDGNDIIYGGEGNDIISGDAGNDNLYGGLGADKFLFKGKTDGIDSIDFQSVEGDKIYIYASGFGGGLFTGQAITDSQLLVSGGSVATNTSQRLIYNSSSGGLFFDLDGSGCRAAVPFATLSAHPTTLLASDFVII